MVTKKREGLVPVTLTLDSVDVDLLDRLAKLEGLNRSAELRGILEQFRPMLRATVEAFEAAVAQKLTFEDAVARASVEQLADAMPEVERIQNTYLGAMARLEGSAAAARARDEDPRPSSHGGHNPHPHPPTGDSETLGDRPEDDS